MTFRIAPLAAYLAFFAAGLLTAPSAIGQASYQIDPEHSEIVYSMSHPAHDWTGATHRITGTLTADGSAVTGGHVQAPVQSFTSGNRNRDSHMAEATESYIYPNVTFDAQSVVMLPAGEQTPEQNAMVEGTLTFHDVTRPVTVPVLIETSGSQIHLVGSFDVTLTEFAIDRPSLLGLKTKDWIGLHLDLTAKAS